ncbi:MAG: hypothetical protein RPU64_01630 [Candidatus Sedimenticola sp. (ex Thyasira tokunagai)]
MSLPDSDTQKAYTLVEGENDTAVCSPSGRTIMVCADKQSASHYASLLNEAFNLGYKQGYRDGRPRI